MRNIITKAKNKIAAVRRLLDMSSRLDRLEQATFDQLDSALTRIEELEYQLDYVKKEVNRLEFRADAIEEMDISDAVETAISELDLSDYIDISDIDTDDLSDAVSSQVMSSIVERLSQ